MLRDWTLIWSMDLIMIKRREDKFKMIKKIKKEIRILGIDDSPFSRKDREVLVIGTIFRGSVYMDGLLSFRVKKDGNDSTAKIINAVRKTRHFSQLQCIMINGIALGGFNVIDIKELNEKTNLPVIVVIRKMPDFEKIRNALKKISQEHKIELMEKAGNVHELNVNGKNIYVQFSGIELEQAKKILELTSTRSNIPEPLRISHLIASGIVLGESHGRA